MDASRTRKLVAAGLALALAGSGALALVSAVGTDPGPSEGSSSPAPTPVPRPSAEPEALTEAEAVSAFRRLHRLANRLSRQRDSFFVEQVFTSSGPMLERSRARISELLQTQVLDHSATDVARVQVRQLGPEEIRIFTVVHTSPCFVTESGSNITEDKRVVRNEVLWTMRWEGGSWKLHDAELRSQEASERPRAECKR